MIALVFSPRLPHEPFLAPFQVPTRYLGNHPTCPPGGRSRLPIRKAYLSLLPLTNFRRLRLHAVDMLGLDYLPLHYCASWTLYTTFCGKREQFSLTGKTDDW